MHWQAKKMKITEAKLMISAVEKKQYPKDSLPEIALAGRSNVGKSSLINQMLQRKSLARTSSKPGKTRILNFYQINQMFYFVDVPGYGYAKVSQSERKKWGQMMDEYFETRKTLQAVIQVTDSRHAPTESDQQMYDYLKYYEFPVVVIATKIDKVPKNKRDNALKLTIDTLQREEGDVILPFSAETGEGRDEIWRALSLYL